MAHCAAMLQPVPPALRPLCPAAAQSLISLSAMYAERRAAGGGLGCEAEFRAYHLLTMIGTHGRYGYNAAGFQSALSVRRAPLGVSAAPP